MEVHEQEQKGGFIDAHQVHEHHGANLGGEQPSSLRAGEAIVLGVQSHNNRTTQLRRFTGGKEIIPQVVYHGLGDCPTSPQVQHCMKRLWGTNFMRGW